MTLYDLADIINDNTVVVIYSAETQEELGMYDGKESIDEQYMTMEITDMYVNENKLCIDLRED